MKYFGGGSGGGGGAVTSVFGRVGAVVAVAGDYAASLITNDSGVTGATVKDALNTLQSEISGLVTGVSSVFGRVGAVVAAAGDYTSTQITNSSTVTGATVTAALNTLNTAIGTLVPTTRTISTTAPLAGGGDLSANRTLSVATVSNTSSGVAPQTNGTLGQVLTSAAGAGAPTWGTDFGANNLVTTGVISLGTTPALTGQVRIPHNTSISGRNTANGGDVAILTWGVGVADQVRLGSNGGSYRISSSGQQDAFIGATREYSLGAGQLLFFPDAIGTFSLSLLNTVELQMYGSGSIRNMSFLSAMSTANWGTSDRCYSLVTAVAAPTANPPAGNAFFYVEPTTNNFVYLNSAGVMAIGTAILATTITGAANSALVGTSNCLRWSTGNLGFYNTAPVAQAARAGQLTDSTTGTPATTLVDVTTTGLADPVKVNNNFSSVLTKYNALELAIHNIGLTT